jgi:hypothetical protein
MTHWADLQGGALCKESVPLEAEVRYGDYRSVNCPKCMALVYRAVDREGATPPSVVVAPGGAPILICDLADDD